MPRERVTGGRRSSEEPLPDAVARAAHDLRAIGMSEARIYRTLNDTLDQNVSYGQLRRAFRDTGALPSTKGSGMVFETGRPGLHRVQRNAYLEAERVTSRRERSREIGPVLADRNRRTTDERFAIGYLFRNGLQNETRYNPDGTPVAGTGIAALNPNPIPEIERQAPRRQFVTEYVDPSTGAPSIELGS